MQDRFRAAGQVTFPPTREAGALPWRIRGPARPRPAIWRRSTRLYAGERLTVVEGAVINRGWADCRDHHVAPEPKELQDLRYRSTEIEAHVAGDLAWATLR